MQYLLLIYSDESQYGQMTEAQMAEVTNAYHAYSKALQDAGAFKAGDALQPTTTATTVRVRGGETMTTDGPFAETTEQLGGYYLIECDNLDEALGWAAKLPGAQHGSVEVRPIVKFYV
jgi:hypothetical protein